MSTKIQWAGETWQVTAGCDPVSPGCLNCYAAAIAHRGLHTDHAGLTKSVKRRSRSGKLVSLPVFNGEFRELWRRLEKPMATKKPTRFFVNSMSDLFHENASDDLIRAVFGVMDACPQHTFIVLTKRIDRAAAFFQRVAEDYSRLRTCSNVTSPVDICRYEFEKRNQDTTLTEGSGTWPLPNVHLMTSVEDQKRLEERVPLLLQCPAAVRGLSVEPLIDDDIDLSQHLCVTWQCSGCKAYFDGEHQETCPSCGRAGHWTGSHAFNSPGQRGRAIDWVVVGGESGPGARGVRVDAIHRVVEQCQTNGVPVFVKQLGARPFGDLGNGNPLKIPDAKRAAWRFTWRTQLCTIRNASGGDIAEWPKELQVRELPGTAPGRPPGPRPTTKPRQAATPRLDPKAFAEGLRSRKDASLPELAAELAGVATGIGLPAFVNESIRQLGGLLGERQAAPEGKASAPSDLGRYFLIEAHRRGRRPIYYAGAPRDCWTENALEALVYEDDKVMPPGAVRGRLVSVKEVLVRIGRRPSHDTKRRCLIDLLDGSLETYRVGRQERIIELEADRSWEGWLARVALAAEEST